jgi:hypothetical protein
MSALYLSPILLSLLSQAQNLQLGQWQQNKYIGTIEISKRHVHAGAFLSFTNEYLVVDGWNGNYLSDFQSINLTSLQSTLLATSTPLAGRNGMAFISDLVSNFYVHGGWNSAGGAC